MMLKAIPTLFVLGVFSAVYLLFGAPIVQPENNFMSRKALSSNVLSTGFSYSPELAAKFGLPVDDAIPLQAPLFGAAIEIKEGFAGKVCVLHILYDADIDVRLPEEPSMQALGSNMDVFPNGFLRRPDKIIRKFFGAQTDTLANRAIFRYGINSLEGGATSGQDPNGSYTSMPLNGYNREFVPGVGWLAMHLNCELASREEYKHSALYVESSDSPRDMILNGYVHPAKMIEFQIPQVLIEGMSSALRAAAEEPLGGLREGQFSVIK